MPRLLLLSAALAFTALVLPAAAQQIATPEAERDYWCATAFQRVASSLRATDAPSADRLLMFAGALQMQTVGGIAGGATQADVDSFRAGVEARVDAELVKGVTPSYTFDDCLAAGAKALEAQTAPKGGPGAPPIPLPNPPPK